MKRILFIVTLLISAFCQGQDYRGKRLIADNQLVQPRDTVYSKSGLASLGDSLYFGNGVYWRNVSRAYLNASDIFKENRVLTGGIVTKVGGLVINVSASTVLYNNLVYSFPSTNFTLGTADGTNDRFDGVYFNSTGPHIAPGTPANPAIFPDISANDIAWSYISVPATSTNLTSTDLVVRDEGYGTGEWYITTSGMTLDSNYTTNPPHLTKSIRITAASDGGYYRLNNLNTVSKSGYNTLVMSVRNNVIFNGARNLLARLYNNTVQVGGNLTATTYGYVKAATGSPQLLTFPMSAFTGGDLFNAIQIYNTGTGGSVDVQVDNIRLQTGVVYVPQPSSGLFGRTDIVNSTNAPALFNNNNQDFTFQSGSLGIAASNGTKTMKMFSPDGTSAVIQANTGVGLEIVGYLGLNLRPRPILANSGFIEIQPSPTDYMTMNIKSSGNSVMAFFKASDPFLGGGERDFTMGVVGSTRLKIGGLNDESAPDSLFGFKNGIAVRTAVASLVSGSTVGNYVVASAPGTANYTVTTSNYIMLADLTGQANRNLVLPTSPATGQRLLIKNNDASAFNWTFTNGTVKNYAGTTITTIVDQTPYSIVFNGTNWDIIN